MLRFLVRLSGVIVCALCMVVSVATTPRVDTPTQPEQREGAFREVSRYGRGVPTGVHWQPKGDIILVNSISGVWLYTDTLTDLHHFPDLRDASFSPDGRWIVAKEDEKSAIYDAASFERLKHFDAFYYVNFSSDNRYLWYANEKEGVIVLQTTDLTPASPIPFSDKAKSIHWSANGEYLAVVYGDEMEIWEVEPQALKYTLPRYQDSYPNWSPDGNRLLIDHPDNTLELREGATGELIAKIPADERFPSKQPSDLPFAERYYDLIVWKPNGSEFLRYYPSNSSGAIQVFSDKGESLHEILSDQIFYVSFTADSQFLTSSVGIFETQNYTSVGPFYGGNVTRSPDDRSVIAINYDYALTLFDIHSSQTEILNFNGKTYRATWSPDGERLIASGSGLIEIMDIAKREVLYQNDHHIDYREARFSQTGEMVAVSEFGGTLRIFDTRTGERLSILPGSDFPLTEWEWQPSGKLVATTNGVLGNETPENGNIVYVWDAQTGRLIHKMLHLWAAATIAWSPDGKMLASGSGYTGDVFVSDVYTHQRIHIKHFRTNHPHVFWNEDGTILGMMNHNGRARFDFWDRKSNRAASSSVYADDSWRVWNDGELWIAQNWGCEGRPLPRCEVNVSEISSFPVSEEAVELYKQPADLEIVGLTDRAGLYWNADGRYLLVRAKDYVEAWDIEEKRKLWITYNVTNIEWSSDGIHAFIHYKDNRVGVINVAANVTIKQFFDISNVKWMEDAKTIMIRRGEYPDPIDYEYYNIFTGERLTDFPNLDVNMSADGNTLVHIHGGILTLWSRQ